MRWRLVTLVALVALQLAIPAWYGASEAVDGPFLDAEDLASTSSNSVGDEVVVYGQVVALDPPVISHELDSGRTVRFRVDGVRQQLAVGQYLEVYGTVDGEGAIVARATIVRGEREHWYTYGISAVGVLLVLGRIVRDWRLDRSAWTLTPREEPDA